MPRLPKLSLAAKLYGVVAAFAVLTLLLALSVAYNAREHARLIDRFESAFLGSQNVQRVNALIYAVVMESRGIYMSPDTATAKKYGEGLLTFNDRIDAVVGEWKHVVRAQDADKFAAFATRIDRFQNFHRELVRRGVEVSPAAGRQWGDNDANRSVRTDLNKDLEALANLYADRSQRIYQELDTAAGWAALALTALAISTIFLVVIGVLLISRAVAAPLSKITQVIESVAGGNADIAIPHVERHDEIGALARAIRVFQDALRRNDELKKEVLDEARSRAHRQEVVTAEISAFGGEVEATLADLGRLAADMLSASANMAKTATEASARTGIASRASTEASANVHDIASAADELSTSVLEIDRQVAQSNAVAEKAVGEAERTNEAVQELDEASRRIGDVVSLITAIAKQTNLLALNATIEAARAGEAGRGFAIVANEVKALSGQTAQATEEISAQIAGMQNATLRSVEAIGIIQRTIREIGDISSAITAAVSEQGAATREIARSVETAATRTVETAEEVAHVGEATEATKSDAAAVKTVAVELGAVSGRIRGQIDGFFERLKAA